MASPMPLQSGTIVTATKNPMAIISPTLLSNKAPTISVEPAAVATGNKTVPYPLLFTTQSFPNAMRDSLLLCLYIFFRLRRKGCIKATCLI